MNFLKKLGIATLGLLFLVPLGIALAAPSSVDRLIDHIEPLIKTDFIKAPYFTATSTTPNTFPNASTTNISARTAAFGGTATSTFGADGALDLKTGFTFGGDTFDELVGTGLQLSSGDLQTTLGTSIDLASAEVTGVLPYANGGTGTTTGQAGRVPYFGATSYQSIATSTPAIGSVLSYSGTLGNMLGGTSGTFGINNGSVTNAMLANSTISGKALGTSLDALTATNGSLTFSGSYDGSTARTVGLNLANANIWTALQSFANASSTLFSTAYASSTLYFGAGLQTCDPTTGKLTWSAGVFGCGTDNGGGGGLSSYDAWTHPQAGTSATTSGMIFSAASSTFSRLLNIGFATTSQLTVGTTTYLTETNEGWLKYKRTSGNSSLLWISAPDTLHNEATLTLDLNQAAGNRSFLDLTVEDYSGADNIASLNIAKQGTGKLLPFILRFWDQDRGNVAQTGWTTQAWLPNGSIGMGMATSSVSTNTLLHISSSTATYLIKADAAPGTTKMYLDINGQLGLGGVPSEILHLQKGTGQFTTMRFDSGTTQGYFFAYDGDNSVNLGSNSNSTVNIKVNNTSVAAFTTSLLSLASGIAFTVTNAIVDFSTATVKEHTYSSFSYSTTTAWTGTTTIPLGPAYTAESWSGVKCFTDTGTVNVSFYDGSNRMNMLNASTTVGSFSFNTNNTFTASEKRYVDIGTPASTPTKVSCTVDKIVNN